MSSIFSTTPEQSLQIRSDASNIRSGTNPSYTLDDFVAFYPQFGDKTPVLPATVGDPLVPDVVVQAFIDLADTCIIEARWHGAWKIATSMFVAHFSTLWLEALASPDSGASAVISAAQSRGIIASESASDVSASYDTTSIANDLNGWAAWKLTSYGVQLATFGKIYGMGGMMV